MDGGASATPEFLAVLLGLVLYTAAFIAEVVRAGIASVAHGQTEAASSLGLSRGQAMRLVILPQALRVIIPPMTNQYLNLTKNSSLAVAIGYPDVVSIANTALNQTGRAVECIAIIMVVYLTTSLSTSAFMNWYNARVGDQGALSALAAVFTPIAPRPAPVAPTGLVPWVRANLFGDWQSALATAGAASASRCWLPAAVCSTGRSSNAVFAPDADACQAARGIGACWGVVAEKCRFIIFGRYPVRRAVAPRARDAAAAWRCWSRAACARFWKPWLALLWVGGAVPSSSLLMGGGVLRPRPGAAPTTGAGCR